MKTKQLFIVGTRPKDIPENWLIFNAPRPLLGHKEWTGDFYHGRFFVAVDPAGYIPEQWIKANCSLDGWLIKYISEEDAIQQAKNFYHENYPAITNTINSLDNATLIKAFHHNFNTKPEVEV